MKSRILAFGKTYAIILLLITGFSMHLWGPDRILDAKLFYTAMQSESFFQNLEDTQRQAYFINETLDLIFLSSYSLLFYFLARDTHSKKSWMAFVPGVFDLLETTTILILLLNRSWSPPVWLGYATCLKWMTGGTVGIWILVGFVLRKKQSQPSS